MNLNQRAGVVVILLAGITCLVIVPGAIASAAPANNSTASVNIEDRTTNGTTITVDSATLPKGGFVSIHNESYLPPENESVGSVVGVSRYLEPGRHQDVEVILRQPISDNQTVVARAARDGNSNQSFDFVSSQGFLDTAYSRNGNGSAVIDNASVTVINATSLAKEATVTFANQSTAGTNVTVANVTLPDGGFVAVHDTSYLPPKNKTQASVVGSSTYLSPGVHRNVTVPLNTTLDENTSLLASPYQDTNGNESFEYVDSNARNDTPYAPPGSTALVSQANMTINTSSQATLTEGGAETTSESSGSGIAATFDYLEIAVVVCMFLLGYFYLRVTG